jgi:hypothetical protein
VTPTSSIQQRIEAALSRNGEPPLDPFNEPAWFFVANFSNVQNNRPIGQLQRYEIGDRPFQPSVTTDIPGTVVGDVTFVDGHAEFNGGHIRFDVTTDQVAGLDVAKLELAMASPKPLSLIGLGRAQPAADANARPVVYYECGSTGCGLFVANDGVLSSHVNIERQSHPTGISPRALDATIWFAFAQEYKRVVDGKRYRMVHDIVDPDHILEHLIRREFFLYERFEMPLQPGGTFFVGAAPTEGAAPFRGWLEEVIVDPTGGSGGGRK